VREEERGVTQQQWITRWRQSHTPCSIHHQREQPQHEAEREATPHRGGWLSNTGVDGARITCVRCVRHRVELIEMHDRLFDFQSADCTPGLLHHVAVRMPGFPVSPLS
jgi:hypothetical protein